MLTLIKMNMKARAQMLRALLVAAAVLVGGYVQAQYAPMQYFRYNDKRGLNVYETSKTDTVVFDGIKVRVGGDFAIQFQALSQSSGLPTVSGIDTLQRLTNNFNLPAANLNLDVQLADGIRLHMRTYLSSRRHNEGWVKGGYLQFDNLDFIKEGFLSGLMDVATIRFGYNDINYGDMHFRRSDNATVIYNPFVGNYIMDSFTTEPFGEITIQKNGILGVVGITNGRLNQATADPTAGPASAPIDGDNGASIYLKAGYDKQINDDLRFRLTGSYYASSDKSTREYLYNSDRAGARYYEVLNRRGENNDFQPRLNPGWAYLNAIMVNPFVKYQGLEFFGVYEIANNGNSGEGGQYTNSAGELLYRFGGNDQLYVGARYNGVSGKVNDTAGDRKINRQNYAFGWFITDNILAKFEYVTETREGAGWQGSVFQDAKWDGFVIEAAISF